MYSKMGSLASPRRGRQLKLAVEGRTIPIEGTEGLYSSRYSTVLCHLNVMVSNYNSSPCHLQFKWHDKSLLTALSNRCLDAFCSNVSRKLKFSWEHLDLVKHPVRASENPWKVKGAFSAIPPSVGYCMPRWEIEIAVNVYYCNI